MNVCKLDNGWKWWMKTMEKLKRLIIIKNGEDKNKLIFCEIWVIFFMKPKWKMKIRLKIFHYIFIENFCEILSYFYFQKFEKIIGKYEQFFSIGTKLFLFIKNDSYLPNFCIKYMIKNFTVIWKFIIIIIIYYN